MATIGEVELRVSPEVLQQKAEEVSGEIRKMADRFDEMEQIVNRTSYYWIGEAGDLHRKLYKEQKETVDEMIKRLREHPDDLLMIAQRYIGMEQAAAAVANQLSGDVIQ